jgi:hypothetical protein
VSLRVLPAETKAAGQGHLGFFQVAIGEVDRPEFWPPADKDETLVDLNIYQLDDGGGETLIHSTNLSRLGWVAPATGTANSSGRAAQSIGPIGSLFGASLSDTSKFPKQLEAGEYRAEAVVRSLVFVGEYYVPFGQRTAAAQSPAPRKINPGSEDWIWVEAGGAAVEFDISSVNLWPVSVVSGNIALRATVTPRRGASRAQIAQLNQAATNSVHSAQDQIWNYTKPHTELAGAGTPHRKPWVVSHESTTPDRLGYFVIHEGESYSHSVSTIQNEIRDLCRRLSTRTTLPGGTVSISVSSTVQFRPEEPWRVAFNT